MLHAYDGKKTTALRRCTNGELYQQKKEARERDKSHPHIQHRAYTHTARHNIHNISTEEQIAFSQQIIISLIAFVSIYTPPYITSPCALSLYRCSFVLCTLKHWHSYGITRHKNVCGAHTA